MALPKKLKHLNLFNDGNSYLGVAKAVTLPKLGRKLEAYRGGGKIDEDLYEELETVLLTADMGVPATMHLLKDVRERVTLRGLKDASELKQALKDSLSELIAPLQIPLDTSGHQPCVIMLAGVNGAGKTTSIGKLAKYFQSQGKSVLLAAGDTFRAAAREQLMAWGERNNVTVIAQQGGDSAAVCYDAIQAAVASSTARRDITTLLRLRSSLMTLNSRVLPSYGVVSLTGRISTREPGRKARTPFDMTVRPPLTTLATRFR